MASSSGSSTGRRGGRNVGLPRPRAGETNQARGGRALANQQERIRVQNQEFVIDPPPASLAAAAPNSEQNSQNQEDEFNIGEDEVPVALPLAQDQDGDRVVQREVEPPPRVRRSAWAGNNARLNIMARALLLAPHNFELAAQSSQRPADLESVRNIKRLPNNSLAWNNLKHAGKTVILTRCAAELSIDAAYLQASGGATIDRELLRQKMNYFMLMSIPVDGDAAPDPSTQFYLLIINSIIYLFVASPQHSFQTLNSGKSIYKTSERCSIIRSFFCFFINEK